MIPIALAVAMVLGGAACSGGRPRAADAVRDPGDVPGPPITYVAVGASESVGFGTDDPLREAWPQVLYRTAFPRRTVFVNLGIPGATVRQGLDREVPDALGLAPQVATVWLNVNDILNLVTPTEYEQQLGSLVHRLRRDGRTKVLVANTPPLDRLPAYLACRPDPPAGGPPCIVTGAARLLVPPPAVVNAVVDDYNAATARVVAAEGAVLVDLHRAGLAARDEGTEASTISSDGFHPSPTGHRLVAEEFARALQSSGGPG